MISINKPEFKTRQCQCCLSKEDVAEITFERDNIASTIALCTKCRLELVEKIESYETNEQEGDWKCLP